MNKFRDTRQSGSYAPSTVDPTTVYATVYTFKFTRGNDNSRIFLRPKLRVYGTDHDYDSGRSKACERFMREVGGPFSQGDYTISYDEPSDGLSVQEWYNKVKEEDHDSGQLERLTSLISKKQFNTDTRRAEVLSSHDWDVKVDDICQQLEADRESAPQSGGSDKLPSALRRLLGVPSFD